MRPLPAKKGSVKMLDKIRRITIIATALLSLLLLHDSHAGSGNLDALAQGTSTFTLSLFQQIIAGKEGNILFSPYSISMALAMAGAGARGKTSEEIERTLGYTLPTGTLYPALAELSHMLTKAGNENGQSLNDANAIWLQNDFEVQPGYLRLLKDNFGNEARQLNFCHAVNASQTIDDWVAGKTRDHIRDLIPASALNCDTKLVLTNAIYFLGNWASPFKEALTGHGPFVSASGRTEETLLMHRQGAYPYAELEGWQALEMPYVEGRLTMLVLLPSSGSTLADVETHLDAKSLDKISQALKSRTVDVTFPKFEISAKYNLNEYLRGAGINEAFSPQADFSGITTERKLLIGAILHEAWVKVDEKGAEAAAATGGAIVSTAIQHPELPVVFRADHPFLFLIRHKETGLLLFWGRLSSPKDTN